MSRYDDGRWDCYIGDIIIIIVIVIVIVINARYSRCDWCAWLWLRNEMQDPSNHIRISLQ